MGWKQQQQQHRSLPGLRAGNSAKEILLSSQGCPVIANARRTGSAGPANSKYVRIIGDDDVVVEAMMMVIESEECSLLSSRRVQYKKRLESACCVEPF